MMGCIFYQLLIELHRVMPHLIGKIRAKMIIWVIIKR